MDSQKPVKEKVGGYTVELPFGSKVFKRAKRKGIYYLLVDRFGTIWLFVFNPDISTKKYDYFFRISKDND